MFYSQFILAKKGPLGTIWIAAHLERKLRKNQVTETNIGVSVDSILCPEVPIALRLSGHLLLGVVRIYSRKVNYLFHDCSEALVKIKQAFHSGAVDLPPEAATAPFHSITLPETFDLDDLELLPDREALFLANSSIDHHVTSREQITLQDNIEDSTYLGSQFGLDERFTDGGASRLDFDEDLFTAKAKDQEKGVVLEEEPEPMEEDEKPEENIITEELPEVEAGNNEAMELDSQHKLSEDANTFDINVVPVEDLPPAVAASAKTIEPAAALESEAKAGADGVEETSISADKTSARTNDPLIRTGDMEAHENQEAPAVTEEQVPALVSIEMDEVERHENPGDMNVMQEQDGTGQDKNTSETQEASLLKDNEQCLEVPVEQQLEDVPDIEKVRSAAETPLPEANVLDVRHLDSTPITSQKGEAAIESGPLEEDKLQEAEETPRLSSPSVSAMREFARPGDDDLLASILGRRTPSLVVAPTPPAKRHKPGPKPGTRKRKVHFDESMVLDGDRIRQQLSDTSSIRRVRKRAPCTEYEVWGSEKEALGQQMFDEPLILAPCENIREVYRSVYNAGDAKQSESDTSEVSARRDKYQLDDEENHEPITLEEEPFDENAFDDPEARFRFEDELVQIDISRQDASAPTSDTADEATKENSGSCDIFRKDEAHPSDEAVLPPKEQVCPPNNERHLETVAGGEDPEQSAEPLVANDADNLPVDDKMVVRSDESVEEPAGRESEAAEEKEGGPEASELVDAVPETRDHDESRGDLPAPIQEEGETSKANSLEEEMALANDTAPTQTSDILNTDQHLADNNSVEALDFLVDSKDEDAAPEDGADNYDLDYPQEQAQDNSGWSVRTRAVCQYLRVTFETMESAKKEKVEPSKLGLERLLQGKTRRESARMFFESLVLKTKDYIGVEQKAPFASIYISPRPKLMKADM